MRRTSVYDLPLELRKEIEERIKEEIDESNKHEERRILELQKKFGL